MKIAVGSMGTSLDAWVGGRFGYCPQFIVVDTDTMEYVVVPMPPARSEQEASLKAIRAVARHGVEALIVESAKPACREVMNTLGIEVIDGVQGLTVRQAVLRYMKTRLAAPEERVGTPPKIAIATLGADLNARVGVEFGRVSQFLVVDPATMHYELLAVEPRGPQEKVRLATIRALVRGGVNLVITTAITPECCQALWSLAVDVVLVEEGLTVAEVIQRYKAGQLAQPSLLWPGEDEA